MLKSPFDFMKIWPFQALLMFLILIRYYSRMITSMEWKIDYKFKEKAIVSIYVKLSRSLRLRLDS